MVLSENKKRSLPSCSVNTVSEFLVQTKSVERVLSTKVLWLSGHGEYVVGQQVLGIAIENEAAAWTGTRA